MNAWVHFEGDGSAVHTKRTIFLFIVQQIGGIMNRRTLINYQLPYHIQTTISDIRYMFSISWFGNESYKWGHEL